MANQSSNLGYKITIILLSLAVIGLVIDKVFTEKKTVNYVTLLEANTYEKDSLQNELQDLLIAYTNLETDNQSINDSLVAQRQKIADLMKELQNVKSGDNVRIKQLKEEISLLKDIMKDYIKQIDSLYQENKFLVAENTEIKNQYNQEVQKTQQLSTEKDSLQQTVQIAQVLVAYNPVFSALNDRGKTTDRINKTKKFQVCFMLSENKVSQKGRKYIYIRVTKPDGEVLRNDNSGFFNFDGKSIAYSASKEIEYDGSSQNICMYYTNNVEDLPKGTYTVFIFADGKQIGDHKIELN